MDLDEKNKKKEGKYLLLLVMGLYEHNRNE